MLEEQSETIEDFSPVDNKRLIMKASEPRDGFSSFEQWLNKDWVLYEAREPRDEFHSLFV